jgi:hypothetical protein
VIQLHIPFRKPFVEAAPGMHPEWVLTFFHTPGTDR